MPFEIVRNDIVNMQVDAIVNTANPNPVVGYGVDAGVNKKAGPELLEARKQIGRIALGCAAVTPAFGLVYFISFPTATSASVLVPSTGGTYEFPQVVETGYVVVNYFVGTGLQNEVAIELWGTESGDIVSDVLFHSVNKPFAFSGKTAVFTGDSITYGFTSGSTTTQNNYPKLFSTIVGLTHTNVAQGGACFVSGYNETITIANQVKAITGSPDFVFIAGGINDWQVGASLDELKTTLADLCQWINTNLSSAEIIWIAPINQAGWETTHTIYPKGTVDEFRKTIFETVEQYNTNGKYSFVNGKLFGFPTKNDPAAFKSAMFGDLLHPTELGYKTLYTMGLLTALT